MSGDEVWGSVLGWTVEKDLAPAFWQRANKVGTELASAEVLQALGVPAGTLVLVGSEVAQ